MRRIFTAVLFGQAWAFDRWPSLAVTTTPRTEIQDLVQCEYSYNEEMTPLTTDIPEPHLSFGAIDINLYRTLKPGYHLIHRMRQTPARASVVGEFGIQTLPGRGCVPEVHVDKINIANVKEGSDTFRTMKKPEYITYQGTWARLIDSTRAERVFLYLPSSPNCEYVLEQASITFYREANDPEVLDCVVGTTLTPQILPTTLTNLLVVDAATNFIVEDYLSAWNDASAEEQAEAKTTFNTIQTVMRYLDSCLPPKESMDNVRRAVEDAVSELCVILNRKASTFKVVLDPKTLTVVDLIALPDSIKSKHALISAKTYSHRTHGAWLSRVKFYFLKNAFHDFVYYDFPKHWKASKDLHSYEHVGKHWLFAVTFMSMFVRVKLTSRRSEALMTVATDIAAQSCEYLSRLTGQKLDPTTIRMETFVTLIQQYVTIHNLPEKPSDSKYYDRVADAVQNLSLQRLSATLQTPSTTSIVQAYHDLMYYRYTDLFSSFSLSEKIRWRRPMSIFVTMRMFMTLFIDSTGPRPNLSAEWIAIAQKAAELSCRFISMHSSGVELDFRRVSVETFVDRIKILDQIPPMPESKAYQFLRQYLSKRQSLV